MLKIFICPECYNIRMVSKKPNAVCLHCNRDLVECNITYLEYTKLSQNERESYKRVFKQELKRERILTQKPFMI